MPRLSDCAGILVIAVGIAGLASDARADSRLFGARSGQAGVAIVAAVANGNQLAVAGQGGGVTFFRIDNPNGPVPCTTRVSFTGSNGTVVAVDADICANGGQVSVSFSATAAPQPTAPAVPPPTAGQPPAAGQAVVIGTDDPNVVVDAVYLAGREITVTRRVGNGVEIRIPPGPGGNVCNRDLGIVLSDGRRIARDTDFCVGNGQVIVQLVGGGDVAAAQTPLPPPQPVSPALPAQAMPGRWMFSSDSGNVRLVFGTPNTDDITFSASCATGSGTATITIDHSSPELQPGVPVRVGFFAGAFGGSYDAAGSDISQMTGESSAIVELTGADPLWAALIKESFLSIRIGSGAPFGVSLSGSAAAVRQFLALCNPQAAQPPPVVVSPPFGQPPMGIPAPGGGPLPVTYTCDDGSELYVTFYDAEDAVLVAEPNVPPRYLRRQPSPWGVRYAAGGSQLLGRNTDITWQRAGGFPMRCLPR